jgi:hypothetical protein
MFGTMMRNATFSRFSFRKIMSMVGWEHDCTRGGPVVEWLEVHFLVGFVEKQHTGKHDRENSVLAHGPTKGA